MPRDISAAFKALIDQLKYDSANDAEPNFRLDVLKQTPEAGTRSGDLVTDNIVTDSKPALIMSSQTNIFYAVYCYDGSIYGTTGTEDANGNIEWSAGTQLFTGDDPDLEFYGEFTTQGDYETDNLMIVYEKSGTVYFRVADVEGSGWAALASASEKTVKSGGDPTIVRAWADPPGIGETDLGIYVFYISSGNLMFTYTTDDGDIWADAVEIDKPVGGTKGNPKAFRESSYRIACVYEYSDGSKTDIYYILSQDSEGGTEFVNIASPDETYRIGTMNISYTEFLLLDYSAPDETYKIGALNLDDDFYDRYDAGYEGEGGDCEVPDETYQIGAKNLNMQLFTGDEP